MSAIVFELCSYAYSAKLLEASLILIHGIDPFLSLAVSVSQSIFEGSEPGILLNNACDC
jgi:hypothetical protein